MALRSSNFHGHAIWWFVSAWIYSDKGNLKLGKCSAGRIRQQIWCARARCNPFEFGQPSFRHICCLKIFVLRSHSEHSSMSFVTSRTILSPLFEVGAHLTYFKLRVLPKISLFKNSDHSPHQNWTFFWIVQLIQVFLPVAHLLLT